MGLLGKLMEEVVKAPFDVINGASEGLQKGVQELTEPKETK